MSEMSEWIEGLSGRWTFFTQVHKVDQPESKLAATVFSVDTAEEIRVGIGRLFDSKKVLGERQAVVSQQNLDALGVQVGERLTLHYDLKLILNMFQSLTGEILPTFLTRETEQEQLKDPESRKEIVSELSNWIVEQTDMVMDSNGYIKIDFEDELH